MNRDDVLIGLATIVTLSPRRTQIAVMLSSFDEVKKFHADLTDRINEIPVWLRPIMIRNTKRVIEFEFHAIYICHLASSMLGMSLDRVYTSSTLIPKQRNDLIRCVAPGMCPNTIIDFYDTDCLGTSAECQTH